MPNENKDVTLKQLQTLLEQNLERTAALEKQTGKIYSYIKWQSFFFVLKVIIIVVPVVLGIIYLPPLLQQIFAPYEALLGNVQQLNSTAGSLNSASGTLDINAILNGFSR
ncbi:hypothetical protein A2477_01450 [Candidatus Falkowbacteria bacterium RIFOXYC2_FULL_47_12]|uniref:Uncharacterized protein n=1 Tax=Candidatus Falkowbacteria bacterium RIFOXYC2_FULL_47_12 TaxID=1798004 RepID=A0A1F5TS63_9BACT|nr:MAG: hypothetical protein A2477_01450 [Candidatus Falkowbacteria bacterium RIFOXYC2_FULL_47_12]